MHKGGQMHAKRFYKVWFGWEGQINVTGTCAFLITHSLNIHRLTSTCIAKDDATLLYRRHMLVPVHFATA